MKLALLQNAQELGLRSGVQIADFIEEDGAAIGQLELALARGDGAGECALLVAEQLAFEQVGWNGGAVHFDERAVGERAFLVDVRGQQFLAGARFAHDQDAGIGSRGHGGLFHHAHERRAGADHLGAGGHQLAQPLVLAAQADLFQRVLERQQNLVAA